MYCLSTTLPSLGLGALLVLLLGSGCKSGNSRFASVREPNVTATPVSMRTAGEELAADENLTIRESATTASSGYLSEKPVVDEILVRPSRFDIRLASIVLPASQLVAVATEDLAIESGSDAGVSSESLALPASQSAELAYSLQGVIATSPKQNPEPVVVETLESPAGGLVSLTLPEAINIALGQNPNLIAVRASEPVARGALVVSQTYPYNPQYQVQVLPSSRFKDGSDGAVNNQHVLMQTFELGGQQRYREGVAAGLLRQVQGTISQAELTNVALTSRLYFTAIYQRELRDLNRTLTDLNESQIGVIERRVKAGQANPADVALTKLQAQASRRQQRLSEANYRTALLALRTQLNKSRPSNSKTARSYNFKQPSDVMCGHARISKTRAVTLNVT